MRAIFASLLLAASSSYVCAVSSRPAYMNSTIEWHVGVCVDACAPVVTSLQSCLMNQLDWADMEEPDFGPTEYANALYEAFHCVCSVNVKNTLPACASCLSGVPGSAFLKLNTTIGAGNCSAQSPLEWANEYFLDENHIFRDFFVRLSTDYEIVGGWQDPLEDFWSSDPSNPANQVPTSTSSRRNTPTASPDSAANNKLGGVAAVVAAIGSLFYFF